MAKPQIQRQPNIRVLTARTRLRKWRLLVVRHPYKTGIIAALTLVLLLIVVTIGYFVYIGYKFQVGWMGLSGPDHQITTITTIPGGRQAQVYSPMKTVWDWLELLIVPAVLAGVGSWFTLLQHKREQRLAHDELLATKFQAYIDFISKLLLEKNLLQSKPNDRFQKVARAQTLTVLRELDADRKGHLLTFLFEAELIKKPKGADDKPVSSASIVDLNEADLRKANLEDAVLSETVLDYADLSGARLSMANLTGASLYGTKFIKADLSRVFLQGADLTHADLIGADLSGADLSPAHPDPNTPPIVVNLSEANLSSANLTKTNLSSANLEDAILDGANLRSATYDDKQLEQAKSRIGLILRDGSKYSPP